MATDLLSFATDYRLAGVLRTDLRSRYGAPLNGRSNPLSSIGLDAAQNRFSNIGLTTATNLDAFEYDTAAWLQAEYDLRTGVGGGIIALPVNAQMMVSQQLWLHDASKVWFHGAPGAMLLTKNAGAGPAVRVSGGGVGIVLADFYMLAQDSGVSVSQQQAGVAHKGFRAGASALMIENSQGSEFHRVLWNGFDQSTQWGDNTWGIRFVGCVGSGNNSGLSWSQTTGLNSMERMILEGCTFCNNNYGIDINTTYTPSGKPIACQGGSWFVKDCSLDYNVIRQARLVMTPPGAPNAPNGIHFSQCHIETTGQCSAVVPRLFVGGVATFSQCEFSDQDGIVPPGLIEIADMSQVTLMGCRSNAENTPFCYSPTSGKKRVRGFGNMVQSVWLDPILLLDGGGKQAQA